MGASNVGKTGTIVREVGEKPELKRVPYTRTNGKVTETRDHWIIPIDIDESVLRATPPSQMQTALAIAEGVDSINPIYAIQEDPRMIDFQRELIQVRDSLEDEEDKAKVTDYARLISASNTPWDAFHWSLPFPIPRDRIPEGFLEGDLPLWDHTDPPKARGLVADELPLEQIKRLKNWDAVNSTVVKTSEGYIAPLNEERFAIELRPIISSLQRAKELTQEPTLEAYLDATINQFQVGSKESLTASEVAWIGSKSDLDFIIGTGIEKYSDGIARIRGMAQGVVGLVNHEFDPLIEKLKARMTYWEKNAPWDHKKDEATLENVPIIKFLEVLSWTGNYDHFPFITAAESLPNDKKVAEKYGTVNVIFSNIHRAVQLTVGTELADQFLMPEAHQYVSLFGFMSQLHMGQHELGHTTGGYDLPKSPDDYFGEHDARFSEFEEARANLFASWTLPDLVEMGVITEEQKIAGYYNELIGWAFSLMFPAEDHSGAANMCFHYFLEKGAIVSHHTRAHARPGESVSQKFTIDIEKWEATTAELLGKLTDWKAVGDYESTEAHLDKYISMKRAHWVRKTTSDRPLGRLLVFPQIKVGEIAGSGRTSYEVSWPKEYMDQKRTIPAMIQNGQL